jgi:hypothetical protein
VDKKLDDSMEDEDKDEEEKVESEKENEVSDDEDELPLKSPQVSVLKLFQYSIIFSILLLNYSFPLNNNIYLQTVAFGSDYLARKI